jgi:acyl-CoA synthetase (AMP-forming)/AMP-acid ligase II
MWRFGKNPLIAWRRFRGVAQAVSKSIPQEGSIGLYYNRKHREIPHRALWRRKAGAESSWNQCKKSFEALATNLSNIQIGDRVLLIGDCDIHMVNLTLAVQKRGATLCSVPIQGLTTRVLEEYIELLRPKVIFLAKDKVRVYDPLSAEKPKKMELDLYTMIWKIFPISTAMENMPLRSRRYDFVENIILCSEAEALNQHDMVSNIKYFEVSRDQDYYESPLVHIAMHTSPASPALAIYSDSKWTTHTHNSLIRAGFQFACMFFGANERVILLPGMQSLAAGYLMMYSTMLSGGVLCFAEDQLVTAGDCWRITRSVYTHSGTCIAGTKEQWNYLLKNGDAAEKRGDPQKKWFESLKLAVVFVEELEKEGNISAEIKEAFGISRVEIIRGSPETLNFTSIGEGQSKLIENVEASVKDDNGAPLSDQSKEGWIWLRGPHVSAYYQNHIGLMQVPKDDADFIKTSYRGTIISNTDGTKTLQISSKEKMKELVL